MAVVVFGGINLDLAVRVPALPRPGETAMGEALTVSPGGKGANQALAARRAGQGTVRLVGCVGRDSFADTALALLKAEGVDLSGVQPVAGATGTALIAVGPTGENQIAVAPGANAAAAAAAVPDSWLAESPVLVLQLEVPAEASFALVRRAARNAHCIKILNAAPAAPVPADVLDALDVLVGNEHEIPAVAKSAGLPADTLVMSARALAAGRKLAVVATLGEAGALAFQGSDGLLVPTLKVEAIDAVGAGDAFVGVLAAGIDGGLDLAAALAGASVAGALACTRSGAQAALPAAAEIAEGLKRLAPIERVDFAAEPEPAAAAP